MAACAIAFFVSRLSQPISYLCWDCGDACKRWKRPVFALCTEFTTAISLNTLCTCMLWHMIVPRKQVNQDSNVSYCRSSLLLLDSEVVTYFIRSKSSAVKYGELYEHKCVTIPIETMSGTWKCVRMCGCACMCLCVHVCVRVCVCACMCVCNCVCACMCVCTCNFECLCMHACVCV